MTEFRKATREQIWLLLGLAGGTGSGKTYSALELATGLAAGSRFAVIDTENGRARHYADQFDFDVADLEAPFRPNKYADAVESAVGAGYGVIVVDSMSHEHAGDGGLLDFQEEEYQRLGARDAVKMTSWIQPKREHKRMLTRLLQVRAHLILCFRAEEKIEMVKDEQGKWAIVPKRTLTGTDGWVPIAERNLPYELTASLLLKADAPGVPIPIKLEQQHRELVPLDRPLRRETGAALASWAAGAQGPPAQRGSATPVPEAPEAGPPLATNEDKLAAVQIAAEYGLAEEQMRNIVASVTGTPSLKGAVTVEDMRAILMVIRALGAPQTSPVET